MLLINLKNKQCHLKVVSNRKLVTQPMVLVARLIVKHGLKLQIRNRYRIDQVKSARSNIFRAIYFLTLKFKNMGSQKGATTFPKVKSGASGKLKKATVAKASKKMPAKGFGGKKF